MSGSVKCDWPGVLELCAENRSGGLGKSSKKVSEFAVDEDEEWSERFTSGSSAGQGGKWASAWSCESGAADT